MDIHMPVMDGIEACKVIKEKYHHIPIVALTANVMPEDIKRYNKTGFNSTNNSFDFDQLKTERIFHLDQIRKVCIDYRLRFLDIKYFKGNIPFEAIQKITLLEKKHQTDLEGFKNEKGVIAKQHLEQKLQEIKEQYENLLELANDTQLVYNARYNFVPIMT